MTQLLVRTPLPYPTESFNGYLIRIAEENGYETPRHVLQVAGLYNLEGVTSGILHKMIAPILGFFPSDLAYMGYCDLLPNGKRDFKLLGQSVGPKRSPHPLRLSRPQLCVACVEDNGFVDAFWDLNVACVCPIHKQEALQKCKHCNRRLNVFRPGLLKCKCGARFENVGEVPSKDVLPELMAILMAKAHGKDCRQVMNNNGLPVRELESLSLRALVVLLPLLGNFALGNPEQDIPIKDIVSAAAETLANWPKNFHVLLRRLDKRRSSMGSPFGMRKRFESFYLSMFKRRGDSLSFEFLREEFVRFGVEEWGEGVVDGKLFATMTMAGRFVSQAETARQLKVRRVTVRRWVKRGLIEMKPVHFGNQVRYIADAQNFRAISEDGGCRLEQRQAASFIGLPVSVLRDLRNTEHYPAMYLAIHKQGYVEEDLISLKKKLFFLSPIIIKEELKVVECFSLDYVMKKIRFWLPNGKSRFIIDYLDGKVKSVGRTGESIPEIWFTCAVVQDYAAQCRLEASIVSVSQSEAAKRLGCNAAAIPTLIKIGLLKEHDGRGHVKVCVESIKELSKTHLSTLRLAREIGTSARRLNEICMKEGLLVLSFINSAKRESGFVEKERLPEVRSAIERNPIRFPRKKKTIM